MRAKTGEFHKFMRRGPRADQAGPDASVQVMSPSKCVKFFDENTIERKLRRSEIKQNIILDTIMSGSEGEESGDEALSLGEKHNHA